MFSGDRNIPTQGPTVLVGNEKCRLSHLTVDTRVGNFLELSIIFLTYHLATYCIIFVDDVTELMFTVNDARCIKSARNSD